MVSRCVGVVLAGLLAIGHGSAAASACPGRPDALGTSRTITIAASAYRAIGSIQYRRSLPLADREVVLTFDDGPLPAYTARVLEALAEECVQATFFMVGRMASAYPFWVRRVYNAGHTVASHSYGHPQGFHQLEGGIARDEIERGMVAVTHALGDARALAPFFRFPGLRKSDEMDAYIGERNLMTWSADLVADDWKRITAEQVTEIALARLEQRGRGVLLLHDIQARTALALPGLLRALKEKGFRIVHVVPDTLDRPHSLPEPVRATGEGGRVWPVVDVPAAAPPPPGPVASNNDAPPFRAAVLMAGLAAGGPGWTLAARPGPVRPGTTPPDGVLAHWPEPPIHASTTTASMRPLPQLRAAEAPRTDLHAVATRQGPVASARPRAIDPVPAVALAPAIRTVTARERTRLQPWPSLAEAPPSLPWVAPRPARMAAAPRRWAAVRLPSRPLRAVSVPRRIASAVAPPGAMIEKPALAISEAGLPAILAGLAELKPARESKPSPARGAAPFMPGLLGPDGIAAPLRPAVVAPVNVPTEAMREILEATLGGGVRRVTLPDSPTHQVVAVDVEPSSVVHVTAARKLPADTAPAGKGQPTADPAGVTAAIPAD